MNDALAPTKDAGKLSARAAALVGRDTLLVVGGQQREARSMRDLGDDWYGYGRGIALEVGNGEIACRLDYVSQPGTCLPTDPILFKSATVRGDRLYACTQTEVIVYSLPDYTQLHHISQPWFNDVHHVTPTPSG